MLLRPISWAARNVLFYLYVSLSVIFRKNTVRNEHIYWHSFVRVRSVIYRTAHKSVTAQLNLLGGNPRLCCSSSFVCASIKGCRSEWTGRGCSETVLLLVLVRSPPQTHGTLLWWIGSIRYKYDWFKSRIQTTCSPYDIFCLIRGLPIHFCHAHRIAMLLALES